MVRREGPYAQVGVPLPTRLIPAQAPALRRQRASKCNELVFVRIAPAAKSCGKYHRVCGRSLLDDVAPRSLRPCLQSLRFCDSNRMSPGWPVAIDLVVKHRLRFLAQERQDNALNGPSRIAGTLKLIRCLSTNSRTRRAQASRVLFVWWPNRALVSAGRGSPLLGRSWGGGCRLTGAARVPSLMATSAPLTAMGASSLPPLHSVCSGGGGSGGWREWQARPVLRSVLQPLTAPLLPIA